MDLRYCELVYGLVADWKPGYAKVQFPEYDDIVSDWLQIVKPRAMNDDENWALEKGEQVACIMNISADDRADTGVILGATSNDEDEPDEDAGEGKWRKKFSDGTYLEYDKASHKLKVDNGGHDVQVELNGGGNGGLTITPTLKTQLEKTHTLLQHLVAIINGPSIPEPGGGALSALQIALQTAIASDTLGVFTDIENTNVKH